MYNPLVGISSNTTMQTKAVTFQLKYFDLKNSRNYFDVNKIETPFSLLTVNILLSYHNKLLDTASSEKRLFIDR